MGHGLGLNASNCGKGIAAASDVEYVQAATQALTEARWGIFFIPGIGRDEDLRLAPRHGMHFVRVGMGAMKVAAPESRNNQTGELALSVSENAMKSCVGSAANSTEPRLTQRRLDLASPRVLALHTKRNPHSPL